MMYAYSRVQYSQSSTTSQYYVCIYERVIASTVCVSRDGSATRILASSTLTPSRKNPDLRNARARSYRRIGGGNPPDKRRAGNSGKRAERTYWLLEQQYITSIVCIQYPLQQQLVCICKLKQPKIERATRLIPVLLTRKTKHQLTQCQAALL